MPDTSSVSARSTNACPDLVWLAAHSTSAEAATVTRLSVALSKYVHPEPDDTPEPKPEPVTGNDGNQYGCYKFQLSISGQ